jgi:cytochrome b6-f complex iron-sulfur subunit
LTTQPPSKAPASTDSSRRQLLCGLAVALLAPGALAAACGGDSGGTSTGAATTTGGAGGTTSAGGSSGGTALAKLADVPVGGGVIVNGGPNGRLLLVQPTAGTVKGYDPSCTHQGTIVDPPQGGVMTCPKHGSQFNAADGSVERGPAASPLATVDVRIDGADVVLA